MSTSDEEPYSTIFASLNHPVRRKILRMLSQKPMSFSEILETLGVSSSFLTYHIDNLGELVSKTNDGKYALSSFGEAAIATMSKVEDIPKTSHLQQAKSKIVGGRTLAIALGIICIILAATLIGAFAYYVPSLNSKNSTISSLNYQIKTLHNQTESDNASMINLWNQIDSLEAQITELENNASSDNTTIANLQDQLNLQLNWASSITGMILSDPSSWVNRTVVVGGDLSSLLVFPVFQSSPWSNELFNGIQPIGVSIGADVKFINGTAITLKQILSDSGPATDYGPAIIYGVVEKGTIYDWNENSVTYYIEAEIVEPLNAPARSSTEDVVLSDPSVWGENRAVVLQGLLSIKTNLPNETLPYNMLLSSGNQSIGILWGNTSSEGMVRVFGVIREGYTERVLGQYTYVNQVYYVEAQTIEPL